MMYKNDFVAVLKVDGKILREDKNTVYVPFGSEYSILLKNLYSRRAVVSISIDGQDVLNGDQIVVRANHELELERFLEKMDEGNRFKFIQKTKQIQEHRGDKIDDGIIRIEFQFEAPEKVYQPVFTHRPTLYSSPYGSGNARGIDPYNYSTTDCSYDSTLFGTSSCDVSYSASAGDSTSVTNSISTSNLSSQSCMRSMSLGNSANSNITTDSFQPFVPQQDEGITVKGSKSNQKFTTTHVGELEPEKHVITLQLKGFTDTGKEVETPVTVNTKKKCPTCGRVNKSNSKYCSECGTFLE